ncbi:hypothetical protein BB558_005218 [Smittium angustum]|uniref:FAS1 domain-containing protein n=1 Tax=Smittium angustum TaxID=133377 RepID=A0A2U1J133_SMIAN|nr:hypothetical protein BB558_005218 [Smittium angustum]
MKPKTEFTKILLCILCIISAVNSNLPRGKTTIIDALSSDTRFSKFLQYIQRLQLVIPFNKLRNVTVLAPTNDAIEKYERNLKLHNKNIAIDSKLLHKNPTSKTSQVRNSNYFQIEPNGPIYHGMDQETLLLHVIRDGSYGSGSWVDGMVWESNSGWRPAENNTKSDGEADEKPERQGIMLKSKIDKNGKIMIGNIEVEDGEIWCFSGVVQALGGVLRKPPPLLDLLNNNFDGKKIYNNLRLNRKKKLNNYASIEENAITDYSYFINGVSAAGWYDNILKRYSQQQEITLKTETSSKSRHTLWVPTNNYLIQNYEYPKWNYLVLGQKLAANNTIKEIVLKDVRNVMRNFVSPTSISVARLGQGKHTIPIINDDGESGLNNVTLDISSSGTIFNGFSVKSTDWIANDGIAHIIDSNSVSPAQLEWTPRKMLMGLNATLFLTLIDDHGLSEYVDGSKKDEKWTFFVPTNTALEQVFESVKVFESNSPKFKEVKNWLLYHIVKGKFEKEDIFDGQLLRSEYNSSRLGNRQQIIKARVFSRTSEPLSFSNNSTVHNNADKPWYTFSDAPLELDVPVKVEDYANIYVLSAPMSPPESILVSLIQNLDYSLFIGVMGASGLTTQIQNMNSISVLIPKNEAFQKLGLSYSYLTLANNPSAKKDLSSLVGAHVCTEIIYSDSFEKGCQNCTIESIGDNKTIRTNTVNNTPVWFQKTSSGELIVSVTNPNPDTKNTKQIEIDKAKNTGYGSLDKSTSILHKDIAFSSGVIHMLSDSLLLPNNLIFSPRKLLSGMNSFAFTFLLKNLNLTYVLDPISSETNETNPVVGYSFLVPPDYAWNNLNAYREFYRRVNEPENSIYSGMNLVTKSKFFLEKDKSENPWRNKTTEELQDFLLRSVKLHILPIRADGQLKKVKPSNKKERLSLSDKDGFDYVANSVGFETLLDGVSLKKITLNSGRTIFSIGRNSLFPNPSYPIPPTDSPRNYDGYGIVLRSGSLFSFYGNGHNGVLSHKNGAEDKYMMHELDIVLIAPGNEEKVVSGIANYAWYVLLVFIGLGLFGGYMGLITLWIHTLRTHSGYEEI